MRSHGTLQGSAPVAPFLSWAGGKQRLVPHLLRFLPCNIQELVYHEPFLGAGSLFFAVRPSEAFLSDANEHLIACFRAVRNQPDLVSRYLAEHKRLDSHDYYYKVRREYNEGRASAAQAARFIYLNKACFNGVFRVNRNGEFNVPYGRKGTARRLVLPGRLALRNISKALAGVSLEVASYEETAANPSQRDFFYLDPPYPPLNGTSFFTHYTKERFTYEDHEAVANLVRELDACGAKVMVSNADTPKIRSLYKGFQIHSVAVSRYVTCRSKKHKVSELIVTNYRRGGGREC